MGFWIFMLGADLLIPLVMEFFGHRFLTCPPKEINVLYGYRTALSMKNRDTWAFAHQYCGRLWRSWGLLLLPVTVLAQLPALGKDAGTIGLLGGAVCLLQGAVMAGTLVSTERALRRRFHPDGTRR
ncbi:MAG: SdpI family protein [Oscillospiraceae bacterium]|nr:SdpI family protein [Oscillospiraceae bacterium]